MTLPINTESYDFKFNKTLNEDVRLKSDEFGKYDLDMDNGDYINIVGLNSLQNACIIAILTRFGEIKNSTYNEFGCHVHDLIKDNQNKMTKFKLETYILEVLGKIRRIKTVNWVNITANNGSYDVGFNVTSINDETVGGKIVL